MHIYAVQSFLNPQEFGSFPRKIFMYQTLFPSPPPRNCQDAGRTIPTPPYLDLLAPGKASRKQLGYFSTKHRAIHRAFTIKNVGKK